MAGGRFAHGAKLTVDTAIANLTNIAGLSVSADMIDVTTHDSENAWREFVQGLKDAGEVVIEGNLVTETAANVLFTKFESGVVTEDCTIEIGDITWTFDALIQDFETEAPHDDKASFTATLKVTGKPTLTATTI